MDTASEYKVYEFDDFRFDVAHLMLYHRGAEIPMAPKAVETLLALIERRGKSVSKDELLEAVWPDTVVEESNLFVYLSVLRKTLGALRDGRPYVETLRRRGYRFNGEVHSVEANTQNAEAQTRIFKAETYNSVAVLPFFNLSSQAENEYFCDGLAEELLNALAKIEGLQVAARTSAFSFKGKDANVSVIGRALNVQTVLEGTVRKSGNRLRITVQLVDTKNGYHLWSERYDREMQDIFDVQDEITLAVVDILKVKLLGEAKATPLMHHTENIEAYQ